MKPIHLVTVALLFTGASALAQGCSSSTNSGGGSAPGEVTDAAATDSAPSDAAAPIPDALASVDGGVDATTDAGPDAAPTFDPKSIAGLVLWLDPATGVTESAGKVSAWKDSSASGITVSQPTAANQPTKATVNGKPIILGTPTTWLEASNTEVGTKLDFGDGDMFVAYVVAVDLPSVALGGVLYKTVGTSPYNGLQLYANISGDGKPAIGLDGDTLLLKSPSGNMGDGKLHVVSFQRYGMTLFLRVDGVAAWATPPATDNKRVVDNTSPLDIGGRPSGVHSLSHKLGDVLIYKSSPTSVEIQALETFLKTKNGI